MIIFSNSCKKIFEAFRFENIKIIPYTWFSKQEVAALHTALGDETYSIDDQTWKDVGIDQYIDKLASNMSIFGRQLLYRLLRQGKGSSDIPKNLESYFRDKPIDPMVSVEAEEEIVKLRRIDIDIASLLFADNIPRIPKWLEHIWVYWILLGSAIALFLFGYITLSLCILTIAGIFNATVQIRFFKVLEKWKKQEAAIRLMVEVASKLAKLHATDTFADDGVKKNILHQVSLVKKRRPSNFMFTLPGVEEYANAGLLYEYQTLQSNIQRTLDLLPELRAIYFSVCETEITSNLIKHLENEEVFAWVLIAKPMELLLSGVKNPFIHDGESLDVNVSGAGLFLTGQNGVGKSTLLRTIGINLIIGRALGFCYAASAVIPFGPIASGIQLEDSLADGRSKYMVELARAAQLLDLSKTHADAVLLIDEIFQGTNHNESVSAATAVLTKMSKNALVFASSHNLILSSLLRGSLSPYCLSRSIETNMKLELRPGVLGTTNGISMMCEYGFSKELVETAMRISSGIERYMVDISAIDSFIEGLGYGLTPASHGTARSQYDPCGVT